MIQLFRLDDMAGFPDAQLALEEPNGLLAFGGDLSVPRLISAYQQGIFPWFSEGEPILWWSPDPRGLLLLDEFHASRSLIKLARQGRFTVTLNRDFSRVIEHCAQIPRQDMGTWITPAMVAAYKALHAAGHAHSIEVWEREQLVGGLYGVGIGGVFCGESMFSVKPNTSKLALYYLVRHLREMGGDFIDCQMQTAHLASLGCRDVRREEFLRLLAKSTHTKLKQDCWKTRTLS